MNSEPAVPHVHDIVGVQKLKAWHEMLADYILLNPTATQQQIADHFERSPQMVQRVLSSDLFKMYFEQRKKSFYDKVDETAVDRIQRKLHGVTERALDVLDEKIQNERRTIGLEQIRDTLDMTLKAVGYGSPKSGGSVSQTNVTVVVDRSALQEARELHAQRRDAAPLGAALTPPDVPVLIEAPSQSAEDIDL